MCKLMLKYIDNILASIFVYFISCMHEMRHLVQPIKTQCLKNSAENVERKCLNDTGVFKVLRFSQSAESTSNTKCLEN